MSALPDRIDPAADIDVLGGDLVVRRLVKEKDVDSLDHVRRKAEALALYEERAGNKEREERYARLRMIAEAGLGVVSFDSPELITTTKDRWAWRSLAATWERGELHNVMDWLTASDNGLTVSAAITEIRRRGHTRVPQSWCEDNGLHFKTKIPHDGIAWRRVRRRARDAGLRFDEIPCDPGAAMRQAQRTTEQSRKMLKLYELRGKFQSVERQRAIAMAAKIAGPQTSEAYALLRRCLQALETARAAELDKSARLDINQAMAALHAAEDRIGSALRVIDL